MPISKYDNELHPDWAWSLAIQGKTIKEIAQVFDVARSTLNKWIKENPDLEYAINSGREAADAKVERSLYERAVGYTYKERKVINIIGSDGKPVPSRVETTEKHVPPDTTAQIYWLKNRQRGRWKDKWEVDMNTDKEIVFNITPASQREEEEEE